MNKTWIKPGVGLLVGLLLAYGFSTVYINHQLDLVDVYVAMHTIDARTLISEADIELVQVPKAYLNAEAMIDKEQIIGKYTLIQGVIPKGSYFYGAMLQTLDNAKDRSTLLLKDLQVVFTLEVNLVLTAGNTLSAGQKVDIYGTLRNSNKTIVDLLISQVRILSIKDKVGNEIKDNSKESPKLMLLAIQKDQVALLTKMLTLGDISFTATRYDGSTEESMLNQTSTVLKALYER